VKDGDVPAALLDSKRSRVERMRLVPLGGSVFQDSAEEKRRGSVVVEEVQRA